MSIDTLVQFVDDSFPGPRYDEPYLCASDLPEENPSGHPNRQHLRLIVFPSQFSSNEELKKKDERQLSPGRVRSSKNRCTGGSGAWTEAAGRASSPGRITPYLEPKVDGFLPGVCS